jgi:hypothetical protein
LQSADESDARPVTSPARKTTREALDSTNRINLLNNL